MYELSAHDQLLIVEALDVLAASAKRAANSMRLRNKQIADIHEQHYADITVLRAHILNGNYSGPSFKPQLLKK